MKIQMIQISKNLKLIIIFSVLVVVFLVVVFWLLFGSTDIEDEIQTPNQAVQIPPKESLPNKSKLAIDESSIKQEQSSSKSQTIKLQENEKPIVQEKSVAEEKSVVKLKPQPIKIKNMKSYLNSVKNQISIYQKSFFYDNKNYQIGDDFEGFLVEDIKSFYIRFYDKNTGLHYNLRFLEEGKK